MDSTKHSAKRQAVFSELLSTEQNYVSFLKLVIELYLTPLRSILSKVELSTLFSNLEAILDVNEPLLKDLEIKPESVGSLFLQRADLFKIYAVYCSNQPRLSKTVKMLSKNPKFLRTVDKANRDHRCQHLQLEDFLILPMQRITRYPMLLSALQATLDDGDLEKEHLEQAVLKIKNITLLINERTRQVEAVEKLVEIQGKIIGGEALGLVAPGRTFLFEGRLRFKKMLTSNLDNPWAFLFSDMLMICSKDPSEDAYLVKKIIPFDDGTSLTFQDLEEADDPESIEITTTIAGSKAANPKTYKVKAFGKSDKDKWLKHFRSIEEARAAKQQEAAADTQMSAADVKATVKQKLNSLRHLNAVDSRVAALGTWRESRSLSRPNLSGLVSPRETPKLEKTNSAKSLATSSLAPSSEKLLRRPASRELAAAPTDDSRPHHTRDRSSTYGGPPPLSLLTEEDKRELESVDFLSTNHSDPSLKGDSRAKRKSTDRAAAAAASAIADTFRDSAVSSSSSTSSASPSSSESEADKKPGGSNLQSDSASSPSASKRMSKAKLNLKAISAFAASVIRGKKKDDSRTPKMVDPVQPDPPQTARAVLMSSTDSPVRTDMDPVVPPAMEAGRIVLRGSARTRKNAVTEVPAAPESLPSDPRIEPKDAEATVDMKEPPNDSIFSHALLDVLAILVEFDDAADSPQLTPIAARSPSVQRALEIIMRTGDDRSVALASSIVSRFPSTRTSLTNAGDRRSTTLSVDLPIRSESSRDIVKSSPRQSRSTPGIIIVSSPRTTMNPLTESVEESNHL